MLEKGAEGERDEAASSEGCERGIGVLSAVGVCYICVVLMAVNPALHVPRCAISVQGNVNFHVFNQIREAHDGRRKSPLWELVETK
ncbi:hypothetical protein E2C01_025714 [Portunus trituberculatus]|uniref:Uncharacterized protein n=1 Tax=Portunus trituberculatus TaxID=210409 RepID=A0A5B7EG89_PORTR|nr:hypothetical protein [Portunus trituberculatus]